MKETVTGMVLSAMPVGEYDLRLLLLTKERGKITAFASGAKRTNSPYRAGSRPFSFGSFEVLAGRNAYKLVGMNISNYFEGLLKEIEDTYLAFYCLEIADYYGREGIDGSESLNLLYATFRALERNQISKKLIKSIYELKSLAINGEQAAVGSCYSCGEEEGTFAMDLPARVIYCSHCAPRVSRPMIPLSKTVLYALRYVTYMPIGKLYHFQLKEEEEKNFNDLANRLFIGVVHKDFKSLGMLESLL